MSKRLPKEMNNTVYEFYVKHLDKGTYITRIADIFNNHFGTSYPESTLRNRYEYQRDVNNVESDIVERLTEIEEAERKIALQEMNIVSKQKKLQRQQSAIDSQLRYNADKELIAEVYKGQERSEFEHLSINTLTDTTTHNTPIFNLSDVHLGYSEVGYYDLDTAIGHITNFFNHVHTEINKRKLKEVIISDTGDQIEGSTLRATQLFNIAQVMTQQATTYSDVVTKLLSELSENNPDTHIKFYFVDEDNHSQIRVNGANRGDTTEMLSKVIANDIRKTVETSQRYGGMENIEFYHAGNIFVDIGDKKVLFTHGHQYPRVAKQLAQKVFDVHGIRPDVIIHGHFHTYTQTTLNTYDDFMQTVISVPAIVGDTRYGKEGLGLTGLSGFLEINIDNGVANSRFVRSKRQT